MTNQEINQKIDELNQIQEQAALLKEQAEAIRDQLKAELDRRKEDSLTTGIHNVFYSCYSKKSVDTTKLKKAGLYDQYSKESVVIQFRITDVKAV